MKKLLFLLLLSGMTTSLQADDDKPGPQGPQGVQGVQGKQGAAGVNGTDGKDGTNSIAPILDAVLGVDAMVYDGKYTSFTIYYDRSLIENQNVVGGRLSLKLGESYEDKEIAELRALIKKGERQ